MPIPARQQMNKLVTTSARVACTLLGDSRKSLVRNLQEGRGWEDDNISVGAMVKHTN